MAVRIVCVDDHGRVLLLRRRGPLDKGDYWEPPGGVVVAGEPFVAAARRKLVQETGIPSSAITGAYLMVERDFAWFDTPAPRFEPFYLARVHDAVDTESGEWFLPEELADAGAHVEPPQLPSIVRSLGVGRVTHAVADRHIVRGLE